MKKLLVVDDESEIIRVIKTYFEDNGYAVLGAVSAVEAEALLLEKPDIILLDIMMPGLDGIGFCRQIRDGIRCPIVFLSSKTEESSKLLGLSSGGDDYITKPFSVRELYARVEAHLRRESRPRDFSAHVQYGTLWVDYNSKECGSGESTIDLTKKEFLIVELLSLNVGQVFSQERIYEKIWGYDADGDAKSAVTEHIKRIRKKLTIHDSDDRIETVWGIGYRWKK